jgi:hypothetical protein
LHRALSSPIGAAYSLIALPSFPAPLLFIAAAFHHHTIHELADGMTANVKGFQLYGMELEASRRRAESRPTSSTAARA